MSWELRDAGLASSAWRAYCSPADADELVEMARSTMLVAGGCPVHVRILPRERSPLVIVSHGLLTYGLVLAGLLVRLHRLGYAVLQVDLPGFGQSGGSRGDGSSALVVEALAAAVEFGAARAEGPVHMLGLGEESLAVYEVAARGTIASVSLHALFDGSDQRLGGAAPWVGLVGFGGGEGSVKVPASLGLPEPTDAAARAVLESDPLGARAVYPTLVRSLLQPSRDVPRFEESPVAVQVIASERSVLWPYEAVVHSFTRLRSPKDLVTLPDSLGWSLQAPFLDGYAAAAGRWFAANPARPAAIAKQAVAAPSVASVPQAARRAAETVASLAVAALEEAETVASLPVGALAEADTATSLPVSTVAVDALEKTRVVPALPPRPRARLSAADATGLLPQPREVPVGGLRIGRAPANDLVVAHSTVSHDHALIAWSGSGYRLGDLGSTNGTFLNEEPVPRDPDNVLLSNGDRVRVGAVVFVFELITPA